MALVFDNSYARLPEPFFARHQPMRMQKPELVLFNAPLADELGLDHEGQSPDDLAAMLGGNALPDGADPVAMVYAGHQFGGWVPRLGDGRALLLGEVVDVNGVRRDLHLKGSGPTRFSRRGDGRAALGPVLREFVVSEAMARLGIPTTRALAAISTGDEIMRETLLPGAALVRVAESHLRVGTFQYFAAADNLDALRLLADYAIARLYPEIGDGPEKYRLFLEAVIRRQARLVAGWMSIGFIHGVMNTDNTSISGETLDYGPCAFMDVFDWGTVFSSIDAQGRYAYGNQPNIVYWNLARLAQAIMPLMAEDAEAAAGEAQGALDVFPDQYEAAWLAEMRRKLALETAQPDDLSLVRDLLVAMRDNGLDYTLTFRQLSNVLAPDRSPDEMPLPIALEPWIARWRGRLAGERTGDAAARSAMKRINPLYIPRNHLVEEVIAAAYDGDLGPVRALHDVLAEPYEERAEHARYALAPMPDQVVPATFCGT
ncbi:protein adenylyltransferase SelO [Pseudochelatococcus contaminans]|uniref:Protein nucleotidyltransferase YdiU n=1 Tax=Pseudochelatococcus contaminans TaxID=1538103 RepID=A0A7W5Z427_9HYPH|nr:YdiU family protein [Pseudochelatococcus contaminans]MBB3809594.1 uncharacterized protein YdiU (UPF0061 family) [Pseudochelatococcus contaminans]